MEGKGGEEKGRERRTGKGTVTEGIFVMMAFFSSSTFYIVLLFLLSIFFPSFISLSLSPFLFLE